MPKIYHYGAIAILQYARKMLHAEFHLLQEVLSSLSAGAMETIAKNLWNSLADDGYRFIGQLKGLCTTAACLPAYNFRASRCIRKGLLPPAENRLTMRHQLQKYEH